MRKLGSDSPFTKLHNLYTTPLGFCTYQQDAEKSADHSLLNILDSLVVAFIVSEIAMQAGAGRRSYQWLYPDLDPVCHNPNLPGKACPLVPQGKMILWVREGFWF